MIIELKVDKNGFSSLSDISSALSYAEMEQQEIEDKISESLSTIKSLTPQCDITDYVLAACSGILCGIMDIFLVGAPGQSPLGDVCDTWFKNRTKDFAKLCGWGKKKTNGTTSSAIEFLVNKFKVPYDQRGAGDAGGGVFKLNPSNHHFKSLGHNPTLLGLFFSILDQFENTSHFVSGGEMIALKRADDKFELRGKDIPSKFFCGIANWIGHLFSDVSGSPYRKGRGMGIPSPLWSWINDIIALKRKLNISVTEFDNWLNELAVKLYLNGYDARFQTAQVIPVFVNEMVVCLLYSLRRAIRYLNETDRAHRSFLSFWKTYNPFTNVSVKRMLTVAHGTFCAVDVGDAVINGFAKGGGGFNPLEIFMRLNIIGVGRFTISIYGEGSRNRKKYILNEEKDYLNRRKTITDDYISGLRYLSGIYNDKELLTFINDLEKSDLYEQAFCKSAVLAKKRKVPQERVLNNKSDIDNYFKRGNI